MKVNNKYREVLENILTNFPGGLGQYPEIYKQVIDVLKEPLRNCDVGTETDQYYRHDNYCTMKSDCKKCNTDDAVFACLSCYAKWSQMSYVKEKYQ